MLISQSFKRLIVIFMAFTILSCYTNRALSQETLVKGKGEIVSFPRIRKAGKDSSLEERLLWRTELEMRLSGAFMNSIREDPKFEKLRGGGYRVSLLRGNPAKKVEARYDLDEQLIGYVVDGIKRSPLLASDVGMSTEIWQGGVLVSIPLEGQGWDGRCILRDKNFKLLFRGQLKPDYTNDSVEYFSFSIDHDLLEHSRFFFFPSEPNNGRPARYLDPAEVWKQKESAKDMKGDSSDN